MQAASLAAGVQYRAFPLPKQVEEGTQDRREDVLGARILDIWYSVDGWQGLGYNRRCGGIRVDMAVKAEDLPTGALDPDRGEGMVIIRRYRESDAASAGRLIARTFSEFNLSFASPEERDRFLGPFRHADSPEKAHQAAIATVIRSETVLVAVDVGAAQDADEGKVVGILRGRMGTLASLFVQREYQRQGIGRRLVERFEQEYLQKGASEVKVAATLYAVPFYLQMGYKRTTGVRSGRSFEGTGLPYQPMKKVLDR